MDRKNKNYKAGSREVLLVCCFTLALTQAFAAGVEVDGATGTSLDTAPNGVPIVNIARPNASGLSHNTYRKFNVDPSGLILNNANQTVVNTQLSGQILGNPSLGAPARVILNEVTSTNRSYLNGYTEVAGQAADVVIANPNGISVNGAGFINAPRVTLTTGLPEIDGFGNLNGFDVRGGDIAIDGDGLNTQLQDFTSIYSHFLQLNAKLHARDLDVALGVNQVDYPGRKIVSTGRSKINRVLLDSSALGGMYSNKIVLVGTDQGLGMKLPPEVIASDGDIRISNDGRLVLQKLDTQGDIRLLTNEGIESTNTVFASGDIDIDARDELDIKSGMIAASGQVTIDTTRISNSGSLVSGLDADGSMNDHGLVEIRVLDLTNAGEIIASDRLDITAVSAVNQGMINAYNNLSVSADVLVNEATLFSGTNAQLLVQSDLTNTSGGSIFAVNDLLMAADNLAARTDHITNDLGLIQSLQGDIDIHATRFDNLGHGDLQYQLIYYDLGKGREVNDPGQAMTIDLAYSSGYTKHRDRARSRWVNEVLSRLSRQAPLLYRANANDIRVNRSARFLAIESQLRDNSSTTPGFLDSGNDLNLHVDEFINQNSVTAAARDINFNISGDYLNKALSATERVTDYQYSTRARHSDNWKNEDRYSSIKRSFYIPVVRNKTVSTNTVTQAGRNITGNIGGRTVNSGVLVGQSQPAQGIDPADFSKGNISLPANDFGLFVKSRVPDSQYLIETNPHFTRYGNFVSSNYLLDRLDFSANATLKRLGDAFYEARLIRDSVFAQSGRRYLDPAIQNDNDQFQYLMDNALIAQGELRLAPGVTLEQDQINRLTRDIVWLEPQEVDGEMVLVPTVYLANSSRIGVRGGRIIAGGDSTLVVASLKNDGLIEAGNSLAIEAAAEVHNRGAIVAGETLSIGSTGNIENISGRIEGRNVAITSSDGSIVNRRHHEDYAYTQKDLSYSTTLVGAAGVIEAENELLLEGGRGIEVTGSDIRGGQVSLKAEKVDITTTVQSENYFAGDKKNHVTESSTRHFASTINGDDIVILSLGKTRVDGSKIDASGSLLMAGGQIDINAVNDAEYFSRLSTEDKTLGESVSSHKSFRSNNIASELFAATVVLVTEHGDIEITGSDITAKTSLVMGSSDGIRIEAGRDGSLDESYRHDSSWFGGGSLYSEREDLEGRVRRSAVLSRIDAGNMTLNATKDVELAGVEVSVDERISAIAENISVRNASDEETTYSKHTESIVALTDMASNPEDMDELVKLEDGKLKVQLGSAVYDNAESSTRQNTAVASQLEADTIQFDANRTETGDITIEGSDLLTDDSIVLNATGDVALLDANHEFSREDLTQEGSAVVNFTVKNEYEQVARAIKAVRDAERDLRHAQDDYDQYKDDLDAQKAELRRLKQQYATGTGFIEQADINDFKRKLERKRDDKEFYQTNIALATATLASKTTALIQQIGTAASSSGTYGFNMGIDLDIEAFENHLDEFYRQSRASNLTANSLSINAGDDAWLRGVNLLAQDSIEIVAEDIDIFAGRSTASSRNRSEHVEFGYSWSLMGSGSGVNPQELGGNFASEGSLSESESTHYINAQLLASNIRLVAKGDTTIRGADIQAEDKLEIVTENLDISSVQNLSSTETHSQGLSYSGAGTGANAAEGYHETLDTQVTRLTGRQVDISVADHTNLEAAVIASVDSHGADNGQLRLTTETLSASSLNNTADNENRSVGILHGQTSTLEYLDETRNSKTKSLATLGSGDIQINDTNRSDTRFLNTEITNTEVAIFDIGLHQGLSGELDVRLLSEVGRKEIAEDWLKTRMIGNTIELMATTERVGIEHFFSETEKTHKTYEAVKQQIDTDPELAVMLQDSSLTPEHKQQMLDQVIDAVMQELGFATHDNKIMATEETTPDGSQILGFYSEQTGNAYINDPENLSTKDLITTAGHEASHSIDHQSNVENSSLEDRQDNNAYAENFGENLTNYTGFALSANNYDGLALSNDHAAIGSTLVLSSSTEFGLLNLEQGDFRLSEDQKISKEQELKVCQTFSCSHLVEARYDVISAVQGTAEATGVATGAVTQVIDDLEEFIQTIDYLIENPEKAERVAETLSTFLYRANGIIEGDQFTDIEKQNFTRAVNNFAGQVIGSVEDAEILDGEGVKASFGEGEKYGIYAASLIPLNKLSKYLKSISYDVSAVDTQTKSEFIRFNLDSEAGGFSQYDLFRGNDGYWNWPENNGFEKNTVTQETLNVGTRLDRYGSNKGSFLAPEITPVDQRSLAPGSLASEYNVYEVIRPLPILSGKTEPWFGNAGGGTQYMTINPSNGENVSIRMVNN